MRRMGYIATVALCIALLGGVTIAAVEDNSSVQFYNPITGVTYDIPEIEDNLIEELPELIEEENSTTWTFPKSLLIPVRTSNLAEFAQDLSFPAICYTLQKMKPASSSETGISNPQDITGTISYSCALVGAFITDVVSFPVRLLTAIPWVISHKKKESHPIYKWLLANKIPKELLSANYIIISLLTKREPINTKVYRNEEGAIIQDIVVKDTITTIRVNFTSDPTPTVFDKPGDRTEIHTISRLLVP